MSIDQVYAIALRGRVDHAMKELEALADSGGDEAASLMAKFHRRFVDQLENRPDGEEGWVGDLVCAYRRYWTRLMLGSDEDVVALDDTLSQLAMVRDMTGSCVEDALREKLQSLGYHGLFGVTLPYRELMAWTVCWVDRGSC